MRLSIIIPVLNEAAVIVPTLQRLAPMRARGHEVIVVDGGSVDDTVRRARPLADRIVQSDRGRAIQMNAGAGPATGDVLWFVHADTLVPEDTDDILQTVLTNPKHLWGRFDIQLSGNTWPLQLVARMMNLRSRLTGIATGDQCLFVRRDTFEMLGGFPEQPLMEDIELSRRLKRLARPQCLTRKVISSSRRWQQRGVLRTILEMWRLRLAYTLGANPAALARRYYPARPHRPVRKILVFARAPEPGKVKTRLLPVLGEAVTTALYQDMVHHALSVATDVTDCTVELWGTPDIDHPFFYECQHRYGVHLYQQGEGNLGDRMSHALTEGLREADAAVLIGTDCPSLTSADIEQCFDRLAEGHRAVLGPAADGGYVLIGLTSPNPWLFTAIDWGTDTVLQTTRCRLNQCDWRWSELPEQRDIDRPDDIHWALHHLGRPLLDRS